MPVLLGLADVYNMHSAAEKVDYKTLLKGYEIIKNTYRTLMTRGMKGCYVYCTDTALAEYLKKLLKQK